jgi:hypothetical protein
LEPKREGRDGLRKNTQDNRVIGKDSPTFRQIRALNRHFMVITVPMRGKGGKGGKATKHSIHKQDRHDRDETGKYAERIDGTLPDKHTRPLYDGLKRRESDNALTVAHGDG